MAERRPSPATESHLGFLQAHRLGKSVFSWSVHFRLRSWNPNKEGPPNEVNVPKRVNGHPRNSSWLSSDVGDIHCSWKGLIVR
jgi:hypothetical protein